MLILCPSWRTESRKGIDGIRVQELFIYGREVSSLESLTDCPPESTTTLGHESYDFHVIRVVFLVYMQVRDSFFWKFC